MNVPSKDKRAVTLIPSILTMNQTLDMTLFHITGYVLENSTSSRGGIEMTITMQRKILSEMMTTYFPSLLLMMITYATTFIKPFFFEAALSVNLTTMLVMTTIFISKMEVLPSTSDIKMIDCWLVLCQLVPFAQVVLLTAIEYLREVEEEGKEEPNTAALPNLAASEGFQDSNDQLDLENEDDITEESKKAWAPPQPMETKSAFVAKLIVIGEKITSNINGFKGILHFPSREKGGASGSAPFLLYLLRCCCLFLLLLRVNTTCALGLFPISTLRTLLEQFVLFSTKDALRRPMTYDNHPIPSHPSNPHKALKTTIHELRSIMMN